MRSSNDNVESEVVSILLEMANGPGLSGREDGVARKRKASVGSSDFPSPKEAESQDEGHRLKTTPSGDGINRAHPGGSITEKRKLIVIPPKQRQSSTLATLDSGFPLWIMYFLSAVRVALTTPGAQDTSLAVSKPLEPEDGDKRPGHRLFPGTSKRNAEGSFVFNSCEKDTISSIRSECTQSQGELPSLTFDQIMQLVGSNLRDARVLEMKVRLQDLLRGALRIFSSTTPPPGINMWQPLVAYDMSTKFWSWVGPIPSRWPRADVISTSPEAWGMRSGILDNLVECFREWLKARLEVLQRIASLPPPPLLLMPQILPRERFKETRNLKNSVQTIGPSCEGVRAHFHVEEALRYSIPDQAFAYTTRDGRKSTVAPFKRCSGKPSKKPREHFILKPNRPPTFTVLCLVRDAAARLPHCLGTKSDICTLVRDSQFVKEDATDSEIKQVVTGALDRLHSEQNPCIRFDRDQRLWSYLHGKKRRRRLRRKLHRVGKTKENKLKKLIAGKDCMLESSEAPEKATRL